MTVKIDQKCYETLGMAANVDLGGYCSAPYQRAI